MSYPDRRKWQGSSKPGGPPKEKLGNKVAHTYKFPPPGEALYRDMMAQLGDIMNYKTWDRIEANIEKSLSQNDEIAGATNTEAANGIVSAVFSLPSHIPIIATYLCRLREKELRDRKIPEESDEPSEQMTEEDNSLCTETLTAIQVMYLSKLGEGNILSAKLALRTLALMASGGALAWRSESQDGFLDLIRAMFELSHEEIASKENLTSTVGLMTTYLLASTLPWVASCMESDIKNCQDASFYASLDSFLSDIVNKYRSPFAWKGERAAFLADFDYAQDTTYLCSGIPAGQSCGDTVWEACEMALTVLRSFRGSGDDSTAEPFQLPKSTFWHLIRESRISTPLTLDASLSDRSIFTYAAKAFQASLTVQTLTNQAAQTWLFPRFPIFDTATQSEGNIPACFLQSKFDKFYHASLISESIHFYEPIVESDGCKLGNKNLQALALLGLENIFAEGPPVKIATKDRYVRNLLDWEQESKKSFGGEYMIVEVILQQMMSTPSNTTHNALLNKLIMVLCKLSFFPAVVVRGFVNLYAFVEYMAEDLAVELAKQLVSFIQYAGGDRISGYPLRFPYLNDWIQEMMTETASSQSVDDLHGPKARFVHLIVDTLSRSCRHEEVKQILPEHARVWVDRISTKHRSVLSDDFSMVNFDNVDDFKEETSAESMPSDDEVQHELQRLLRVVLFKLSKKTLCESIEEFLNKTSTKLNDSDRSKTWKVEVVFRAILLHGNTLFGVSQLLLPTNYFDLIFYAKNKQSEQAMIDIVLELYGHDLSKVDALLMLLISNDLISANLALQTMLDKDRLVHADKDLWLGRIVGNIVRFALASVSNAFTAYNDKCEATLSLGANSNLEDMIEATNRNLKLLDEREGSHQAKSMRVENEVDVSSLSESNERLKLAVFQSVLQSRKCYALLCGSILSFLSNNARVEKHVGDALCNIVVRNLYSFNLVEKSLEVEENMEDSPKLMSSEDLKSYLMTNGARDRQSACESSSHVRHIYTYIDRLNQ